MDTKRKRKPKPTPLEEIQAMEHEAAELRQRADALEREAKERLVELTCGTMADNYGGFNSAAFAAVFAKGDTQDEPETDHAEGSQ